MAAVQKNAAPARTQLQVLEQKFKNTIFYQKNLIDLAKNSADDEAATQALVISIDRFNDDLFELSVELEKIANAAAKEPGND